MTEYRFPTAFSSWGNEERAAIDRVLSSGRLTMGDEVAQFEREFADYHGAKHAIMVNSGSSANLVSVAALFALGYLKEDDKVAVPALAWSTTYAPLVQYGMDLRLIDCDTSWNAAVPINPNDLEDADLIVACSILGNPAHLEEWADIASDALMIEDNCESLGAATASGRKCGTFGDLSTFSFFWSHQVSAIEGGMILTGDDGLADTCRSLRAHGWTRGTSTRRVGFDHEYDFTMFGYNCRATEIHAAVAREQLRKLNGFIAARQKNYEWFVELTRNLPIQHPVMTSGHQSPFGLPFLVGSQGIRSYLAKALRASGIDCRPPTGGSFRLHQYGKPWADQQTPCADDIHRCGMFLGNPPWPAFDQINDVVRVMEKALSRRAA